MIAFSNQILLVFSLYDLRCIILTIGKQIIAFQMGTFAPPALPTQRQEGRLLPSAPLSGVPEYNYRKNKHSQVALTSFRICRLPEHRIFVVQEKLNFHMYRKLNVLFIYAKICKIIGQFAFQENIYLYSKN